MSKWLVWVRGCECGAIHIDVRNRDGSPFGDADPELIRALRETARQIERKEATRADPQGRPEPHRTH